MLCSGRTAALKMTAAGEHSSTLVLASEVPKEGRAHKMSRPGRAISLTGLCCSFFLSFSSAGGVVLQVPGSGQRLHPGRQQAQQRAHPHTRAERQGSTNRNTPSFRAVAEGRLVRRVGLTVSWSGGGGVIAISCATVTSVWAVMASSSLCPGGTARTTP